MYLQKCKHQHHLPLTLNKLLLDPKKYDKLKKNHSLTKVFKNHPPSMFQIINAP